ncbi:dihydrolipoyl dehydrogenase [Mycoplasma yeatsii]|uniref:Dihydrolipoamide dehydrogenase n=1 Tax=Mycoplasma yeatsii TaxID=51365 RepID=A0ABU0NF34_9MOLU|nr:dihydrolipoyl dehydrogenase [Mycoplasma yeatsii]MDQ0568060.1 dihydrolipoamide dehydrogenase [Mycoplasma yeatsii]
MQKFDVVILGAGPGGNGLANILGANKLKVALIEDEDLGGGCINKGCVPTKTLIKSARVYELVKNSQNYGVFSDNVRYDFSQMQQRRIDNKNYFNKNMENNLNSNGVTLFKGYGEVLDQNTIKINDQIISFDKLVLATGSRSKMINLKGLEQAKKDGYLIDSNQALNLKDVPKSLVIIGDGPIGLEFSYLYSTLNTEITILTNTDFLSKFDIDIQISVKQYFKEKNIKVIDNVNISEIKDNKVYYNNTFIQAEKILLAVGRTANNESFKNIDIKKDQNGFVIVDENMKTNFDNIYAIGDITGLRLLSSVAYKTADIVAKDILNFKKSEKLDLNLVPWTIYLNPEIAGIGLTQQELIEKDTPFEIVIINSQHLPKAHAEGIVKDYSFIKFLISTTTNQILGCFMMIDQANILINHIALFMQQKLTFDTLQKSIYTHPTLSEAFYYTSRSKGLKK